MAKVYRRGGEVWHVAFTVAGVRHRESSGATKRGEAQAYLARRILEEQGRVGRKRTADAFEVTPRGLYEMRLASDGEAPDRVMTVALEHWEECHGPRRTLGAISRPDVHQWVRGLRERMSDGSALRYLGALRALWGWGARQDILPNDNPFGGIKVRHVKARKVEGLTPNEVARLFDLVKGDRLLDPAYRLAFFAGLRRGEIVRARWEDIDLDAGTIMVRGSKTDGSTQLLPLHPQLREWVEANAPEDMTGDIVPTGSGDALDGRRRRRSEELGVALAGFHRGRHTLGTALARAGHDMARISKLLRHRSIQTTMRYYAHLSPVDARDDLASFKVPGACD